MEFISLKESSRDGKRFVITLKNPKRTIHFESDVGSIYIDHWTWPAALECRASPSRESRLPRTERTVECANAQQERGKNPQFREKKLLTAQRPRTYTHPTRPIKLLGPPHAYPQPAPTGQAPVVYAARCLHVPPGSNS